MLLLVFCCYCYGVVVIMWILKGCLFKGDRHESSGENQGSEPDESEAVDDGTKFFKTGRAKGKGRFTHQKLSFKTLWIEKKLFSASILIPGRKFRVTEMLPNRSFSVDFNSTELSWLIVALREASTYSGKFSKQRSIGSRSMEVNTVINRDGEIFKLICSFEGRNRRFLFIPSGKNREGWGILANFLAAVSNGGKIWVKKTPHSVVSSVRVASIQQREPSEPLYASSIDAVRGNLPIQEGWTEGYLPDMLKCGLKLSLGAPSCSGEADRRFLWKNFQSEIGLGIVVVEQVQRVSLGLKFTDDQIVRGREVSLAGVADVDSSGELVGEGVAEVEDSAFGEEEEDKLAFLSDVDVGSTLGNFIPKVQNITFVVDARMAFDKDPLAGGPSAAVFEQTIYAESRDELSSSEHSGSVLDRAEVLHFACGSIHQANADTSGFSTQGQILGLGDEVMGSGNERAEEVHSRQISGGLVAGSEVNSFQFEYNGMGSFLGHAHVRPEGSPDMRFMARYEDITIFDNVETLSFDSPVSDYSARVAVETRVEVGVSCLEDSCVICGSFEPCGGSGGSVRW